MRLLLLQLLLLANSALSFAVVRSSTTESAKSFGVKVAPGRKSTYKTSLGAVGKGALKSQRLRTDSIQTLAKSVIVASKSGVRYSVVP